MASSMILQVGGVGVACAVMVICGWALIPEIVPARWQYLALMVWGISMGLIFDWALFRIGAG